MKSYFVHADYRFIYLSLFIALFGFASRAYRWKFAIEHLGYKSSFKNNLFAVCISYFLNLTIPRSGEPARAVILNKYENIPFDKGFGTIVAERIVDLLVFLFFVSLGFILEFKVLKNYIFDKIPFTQLIVLGAIAMLGFLLLIYLWKYSKWAIVLKIKEKLNGLKEGIFSVFTMKKRGWFLAHSLFIWFTYLMMFYVTVFALPETQNVPFTAVIIGFIFGSLAVGLTNSGFGAYPLLVAEVFLLYGIPDTAGTAFGWLVWTSQTALIIVLGGLSFILLPFLNRTKEL